MSLARRLVLLTAAARAAAPRRGVATAASAAVHVDEGMPDVRVCVGAAP